MHSGKKRRICKGRFVIMRVGARLFLILLVATFARAERLPVKIYTSANGLTRDSVHNALQDSRGFLWFCTTEGLSRFDGYGFTSYGTDQGLPHRNIYDLLETRSGIYWVATEGGLCRFNPLGLSNKRATPKPDVRLERMEKRDQGLTEPMFTIYLPTEEKSKKTYTLFEDHAGAMWCGTAGGLYRLGQVDGGIRFQKVKLGSSIQDESPEVYAILEDRPGALWVGTETGLYRLWPDGRAELYAISDSLNKQMVHDLLIDREGKLWVGTHNVGLFQLDPDQPPSISAITRYSEEDGLLSKRILSLFETSDGKIWVGTSIGVNEFISNAVEGEKKFRAYTSEQGLIEMAIGNITEDFNGNLWIVGSRGVIKMARNGFTSYGEADGLGNKRILSIFENKSGDLCVITGGLFLNLFDGKKFASIKPKFPYRIEASAALQQSGFEDHLGEWWIATIRGLFRFPSVSRIEQLKETAPKAIYAGRQGLIGDDITRVFEDSRGDIWMTALLHIPNELPRSGLFRWERATDTIHRYSTADGIIESVPTAFCEDSSGNLWIGFKEGGVARYRAGEFTMFTSDEGVPKGAIWSIYEDKAGCLWIGTNQGGLGRLDDPAAERPGFISYTTADGLASNDVRSIASDRNGRIYITTGRGVNRLDPTTESIKWYTEADGIAGQELMTSFADRKGNIWFGSLDGGLSRFTPESDRMYSPPVFIRGLRIAGIPYRISELGETNIEGLVLGAEQRRVQIDFFGLGMAAGETLRYQYKIEGGDDEWGEAGNQLSVDLSLTPGTYRFLVRAITADGATSQVPATVSFTILRPVWQRWWFISLALIITVTSFYLIYRYRVARLIELERVRTRIATDLHDDIGSSLSQVSVLSEVIRRRIGPDPAVAESLTMIARLSRDLVDSMSDIVWAINPRRDHLSDLSHRMRRFASDVFTARDIEFRFRSPDERHDIRMGADMRREVFLIFKEGVNNIARHSKCSEAQIDFQLEDRWLDLVMSDNGRGFDPEKVRDGNGLMSMRQRAERLRGRLEIDTNDRGTTVRLKARVGRRRAKSRLPVNERN